MERIATSVDTLFEKVEDYSKTSLELLQLKAVSTSADVLSSITALIAVGIVAALFTLFLNISLGLYIGKILGDYYLGFLIVSGFYLVLGALIYVLKDTVIKQKISDLVISKLVKQIVTHNAK